MSDTILPCPFCGIEPATQELDNFYAIWCGEDDCAPQVETFHSVKQKAIEQWNTRVAAPAVTGVPQSIAAIIEAALNKMWAEAALDGDFVTQTSAAAAQAWLQQQGGSDDKSE